MTSIIIPTFNEADNISELLLYLKGATSGTESEIILCDGGSSDGTVALAIAAGVRVVVAPTKGRGWQLNLGAAQSEGEVLYFLYADCVPPSTFILDISESIKNGYSAGCYKLAFDHDHWFLRFSSWCTRFDVDAFRFGDQSLFVTRKLFESLGGYNEALIIMEDQDIVRRIKRTARFEILNRTIKTSSKRYLANGIYRTQVLHTLAVLMHYLGIPHHRIIADFNRKIKKSKF